jgi:hypothetical protein
MNEGTFLKGNYSESLFNLQQMLGNNTVQRLNEKQFLKFLLSDNKDW